MLTPDSDIVVEDGEVVTSLREMILNERKRHKWVRLTWVKLMERFFRRGVETAAMFSEDNQLVRTGTRGVSQGASPAALDMAILDNTRHRARNASVTTPCIRQDRSSE